MQECCWSSSGTIRRVRKRACRHCNGLLKVSGHTPALCHLDYTMAEAGGATNFVREYTLASGGPYCDCGYRKKTVGVKTAGKGEE